MSKITNKLFEFQKKVQAIKRDATNPFFKSKYFDINTLIEEVKPILNELGLIIIQPFAVVNNQSVLVTQIIDQENGEKIESTVILPDNMKPQEFGSAVTYFRRYSLQSMLFLQAEDDDGNIATHQTARQPSAQSLPTNQPVQKTLPAQTTPPITLTKKTCPNCKIEHTGQYATCYNCYMMRRNGITPKAPAQKKDDGELTDEEIKAFEAHMQASHG